MKLSEEIEESIKFWDEPEAEYLSFTEKYDAIERIIDDFHPRSVPKKITIAGYVEKEVEVDEKLHLECLLEGLDEDYGSPDHENGQENYSDMLEETKKYLDKIKELYTSWVCDQVCTEEIDTEKWVRKNAPEWFQDGIKFKDKPIYFKELT